MLTAEELEQYSPSVRRTLGLPRPRWRGVMHRWAFVVSVPLGIVATLLANGALDRLAVGIFALGISAMFGISALVHRGVTDPRELEILFNFDHCGIFFCMATGATAIGLMGLDGNRRIILLSVYWVGAIFGMAMVWLPFHPPRGLMNLVYLSIGWTALPMGPALYRSSGALGLSLLLGGAAFYTVGAIIVGSQRPNPDPHVFGYHEIWHLFVTIAASIHYVFVAIVLAHTIS